MLCLMIIETTENTASTAGLWRGSLGEKQWICAQICTTGA